MRTRKWVALTVLLAAGVALAARAEEANVGTSSTPPAAPESVPVVVEADRILAEPTPVAAPLPVDASDAPKPAPEPPAIRVNHVPEFIQKQIRDQVRTELRQDVVQDVLTQAKEERWGVPGVLPEWIDRIRIKGDLRMRAQSEFYAEDNVDPESEFVGYYDYLAANRAGGIGKLANPYLNSTEERHRLRTRVRLGIDARVTNDVKTVMQLSTGSTSDPVSTNQTLGNTGNRSGVLWDQAYLRYDGIDADRYPWLTAWAGRMANPWLSTDLVWDSDLAFEGLAFTYRRNLRGGDSLLDMSERDRTLTFTAGAFPIQEVALEPRDKWLFGAQIGAEFIFLSQSTLRFGLAYYDFVNILGRRNEYQSFERDYTAPEFMQKGNTLFDIRNDDDVATNRWALASDYNLANFTLVYDSASFAPHHLILTADYVRNFGFDRKDVAARTGVADIEELTTGYQLLVTYGWPIVAERRTWRAWIAYKYLEADAVLDAFTDSDFHLGGTDAKGWLAGFEYAVLDNTWLGLRYLSADEIDGLPLGIDVLQLDLNAKF